MLQSPKASAGAKILAAIGLASNFAGDGAGGALEHIGGPLMEHLQGGFGSSATRMASQLRGAAAITGDRGLGTATASEVSAMGRLWVGNGARVSKDGTALVSTDGTRVLRFQTTKSNGVVKADFQKLSNGKVISNGHVIVKGN